MEPGHAGPGLQPRPSDSTNLWAGLTASTGLRRFADTWRRRTPRPYLLALCVVALGAGAACRQDMHDQPKLKAYRGAEFFADGRGMRPIPEHTIPRGFLQEDEHLYSGKVDGRFTDEFPFEVTRAVLERGRDRFGIYCTPCHGQTGMGNGMVVQRGFRPPPSFHTDQIRAQATGYYFDVMTNGFGAMPDYGAQLAPEDRWAVAAYIRALQLSQRATKADVPPDKLAELSGERPTTSPAVGHPGEPEPGASH